MPALPSSLILSLSASTTGGAQVPPSGLLAALMQLPGPRARRGIRHRLATVIAAVVCAVVASYRSYTAIGKWVADLPDESAAQLGMDAGRRPSEAMVRQLLQALDPDRLPGVVAGWLAQHRPPPATGTLQAITVDGKTIRGSGDADTAARHVLAAAGHAPGVVLASTDVDATTNEITRLRPLLDQIADLRGVIVTADAWHCQRDHVTYLAGRGAHWILTVKGNQPHLHTQLAALPGWAVPDADCTEDRGHGRREIRTLKVLTLAGGIDVPYAAQAMRIRRRRHALDQPKRWTTETVYAIIDLQVHQAKPAQLANAVRDHWSMENKVHWVRDVTYDEDRCQIHTGTGPQVMAALRNAAISVLRLTGATNIAAATRHHARDSRRPLDLLKIG